MSLRIRALTVAIPYDPVELLEASKRKDVLRKLSSLKDRTKSIQPPVWTLRVVTKPIETERLVNYNIPSLFVSLDAIRAELGFDYLAIPILLSSSISANDLACSRRAVNALKAKEGLFLSLNIGSFELEDMPRIAGFYSSLLFSLRKDRDYATQTRISLVLKGPLMTPYFPSGASLSDEFSIMVALLYSNFLLGSIRSRIPLHEAVRRAYHLTASPVSKLAEALGMDFAGIDLSISPWMDESVINLLKALRRDNELTEPTLSSILRVNHLLETLSSEVKSLGFNEIMLPLAEDNGLKDLVQKGVLRIRDFIALSMVCVAGVDMVPLPKGTLGFIKGLVNEILSVALIKPKPMGIRLIATDEEPGVLVSLGRFPETPIPLI